MSGNKPAKASLKLRVGNLVAGTQKHFANDSLAFGGATYTAAALIQLLQLLVSTIEAVDTARAGWQDALKSLRDTRAKVVPLVGDYQSYLVNRFGEAPSTLADFGIAPRKKRAPQTVEQKAAAAQKREATRALRHTMGPKQKAQIKAPAATTPAAAPAGTPPAGSPSKPAS